VREKGAIRVFREDRESQDSGERTVRGQELHGSGARSFSVTGHQGRRNAGERGGGDFEIVLALLFQKPGRDKHEQQEKKREGRTTNLA